LNQNFLILYKSPKFFIEFGAFDVYCLTIVIVFNFPFPTNPTNPTSYFEKTALLLINSGK